MELKAWVEKLWPWVDPRQAHPLVWLGLAFLAVAPGIWVIQGTPGIWMWFQSLGWGALRIGDVQAFLQSLAVAYTFSAAVGLPLLAGFHLLNRWRPQWRWLPFAFVFLFPFVFVAGFVFIVALFHHL